MTPNTNLVDFLQYRAEEHSDRTAYIFLKEGVTELITYYLLLITSAQRH